MRTWYLRSMVLCGLAPVCGAQALNLDFGSPSSVHGVPSPTYSGAGQAGEWMAVQGQVTPGLVDTAGMPTTVSLAVSAVPLLDECGHPGTSGDDAALYDDRWYFDPTFASLTVSGLAPGAYRVHVHHLMGPCVTIFGSLFVDTLGATPAATLVSGDTWSGAPTEDLTFSTQLVALAPGEDLVVTLWSQTGFCCYTQVSGLQIEPIDLLASHCFGDGGGTACPCGNAGAGNAGCANSTGIGGRLVASGTTSISIDDLRLTAHALPPTQPALLFVGTDALGGGAGVPFRDGLRCAGGAVLRLGVSTSTAGGLAFWGPGLAPVGGWNPGATREFQAWYRDPAGPCSSGSNLTHAVRATFVP